MVINLGSLFNKDKLEIKDTISFDESFLENSPIKKLDNVNYEGFISQNDMDEYKYNIHVWGTMIIADSVTLDDREYTFNFNIEDIIDENLINSQNMLDINELLWQNIVLEVPISYTESDADNLSGDNWRVIDEETKSDDPDPRLQKLNDYYKGGE